MIHRRRLLTALALVAAPFVAAPASAQDAPPIKIGMTVSSTGTFALAAQSGERGADIWVDDVNRRGGIDVGGKKRKVELVKLDDRSDKQLVPRVYEALINEQKVDLLFGPFGSTLTAAAANVTETAGKFLVIWSASADSIYQQGYKNVISATQVAGTLLGHPSIKAMHEMGVKKIAFAYVDEPFPAAISQGAADLAKQLGMEVTMFEKFAKGTKDFNILIQKAKASGAEAFYPTAYEGDQMVIARQLREIQVDFPVVYMVYASQPQFLQIGRDADWLVSQTLLHDKINWKVTDGLNRAQMMERYAALFPNAAYPADFQTILAYGAGAVLEKIIATAQSLEPAKLKQAALQLNDKIVVATGQYHIEETGRQTKMEFSIMQNQKNGPEVVWPEPVRTAKAVYPVPKWSERKN
jgi:branched-chain amino acid transport system substrate-binding protein